MFALYLLPKSTVKIQYVPNGTSNVAPADSKVKTGFITYIFHEVSDEDKISASLAYGI